LYLFLVSVPILIWNQVVTPHGKLKEAAKKLDPITQSDIMNGLLEIFLPMILAQRQSMREKILADPDQRAQLAGYCSRCRRCCKRSGSTIDNSIADDVGPRRKIAVSEEGRERGEGDGSDIRIHTA